MHESPGKGDSNEAYVIAILLWGVNAAGQHWAICDPDYLSGDEDFAFRKRLRSPPFACHKNVLG